MTQICRKGTSQLLLHLPCHYYGMIGEAFQNMDKPFCSQDCLGSQNKRYRISSTRALHIDPVYKMIPVFVHNGTAGDQSLVILKNTDERWKQAPLLLKVLHKKAMVCFWAKLGDTFSRRFLSAVSPLAE